jgi:hypothetical protein
VNNWLFSRDVDIYDGQDILFLRGHVNFKPVSEVEGAIRYQDPQSFLDMTGQKEQKILEGTSILIPISVSYNAIGCYFEGIAIENEIDLRNAVNGDLDNVRTLWAIVTINATKKKYQASPRFRIVQV